MKVYIGDVVTVVWSNGAGESDYRVVENLVGPNTFELVAEREFGEGVDSLDPEGWGDDIDADDMAAVFADIVARRGVVE
jgi:hypothetical protein